MFLHDVDEHTERIAVSRTRPVLEPQLVATSPSAVLCSTQLQVVPMVGKMGEGYVIRILSFRHSDRQPLT